MTSALRAFDVVAFDLDDTLLDTSGLLIPAAAREAAEAMVATGLRATVAEALAARARVLREDPRAAAFERVAREFGAHGGDEAAVAKAGRDAFLKREVPAFLPLAPAARDALERLRGRYRLFLVTAGDPRTQRRKVDALGAASYFEEIFVADASAGQAKRSAFAAILERTSASPARCLSVGDRVDVDVAEARALGWRACWLRAGEHAGLLPQDPLERPDFQIDRIEELISTCGL